MAKDHCTVNASRGDGDGAWWRDLLDPEKLHRLKFLQSGEFTREELEEWTKQKNAAAEPRESES